MVVHPLTIIKKKKLNLMKIVEFINLKFVFNNNVVYTLI